ncbi:MAG: Smr/MutS family protein [Paludibacteraceae bacterium]|nr:Smr/MutS family protein [Paludibacteraceae bacterium]
MIYPDNFETKTGFDKIRALVKEGCLSPLGKELVDEMSFSTEKGKILDETNQTAEFVQILQEEDEFPTDAYYDRRDSLAKIRVEGTFLEERELFELRKAMETIGLVVRFFEQKEEGQYYYLKELSKDIFTFPDLIKQIDRILDKFGKIKDNASPLLAEIRTTITTTEAGISKSLQNIMRQGQADGFIEKDVNPAMRDGRLVIPISPAFKRKIKGIVHDESATGKTIFIEPEIVVEANNRIRELQAKEKREVIRILTAFTNEIRPRIPEILDSYQYLAQIDFIRAKALFAEKTESTLPKIADFPTIDWAHATHPILMLSHQKAGKEIVPLDIVLNQEQRILLISGPNAGGKSVCLKTVGLLQYMLQCGMLVPMYKSSQMGIFGSIFIDIGDEQSRENDLSTYSSHLTNMKHFVKRCDEKSILLIDEFGGGTEPQIGGAIAEALLDHFNRKRAFGVITTHYTNLKNFATETEGIVNGAMLYDRHQMRPLFQLEIGNPGSSFAIEIARKIGLPEIVIQEASELVGTDYINMDKYLQDIARDKRYWENKRQNIRQKEKHLEELTEKYEKELNSLASQKKELIREAKSESKRLVEQANAVIENTVRKIKEAQAEREATKEARNELNEFKSKLQEEGFDNDTINEKLKRLQQREQKKKEKKTPAAPTVKPEESLKPGDNVRIKGQSNIGELMSVQGKNAVVAFGLIKSNVKVDQLERVSKNQVKRETNAKSSFISTSTAEDVRQRKLNFKREIDVRGMRGDEALQAITYFIDDALIVGVDQVRILHGTGTGILRQLIRDYLKTVQGVSSFHDEHVQFGGAGITVVEF